MPDDPLPLPELLLKPLLELLPWELPCRICVLEASVDSGLHRSDGS